MLNILGREHLYLSINANRHSRSAAVDNVTSSFAGSMLMYPNTAVVTPVAVVIRIDPQCNKNTAYLVMVRPIRGVTLSRV